MEQNPRRRNYPTADHFLGAARRADELISRAKELERLRCAVFEPQGGAGLEVVFVLGDGGMGKSRLVEEALRRAGSPALHAPDRMGPIPAEHPEWDWAEGHDLAVPDLLDMSQTSYHFAQRFMRVLREELLRTNPMLDFTEYDSAYIDYQQRVMWAVGTEHLEMAAQYAEKMFLNCYKQAAEQVERVVLTLDTCEKLAYPYNDWLIHEGLVARSEIPNITQWLANRIENGDFPNTTLILVGRKSEGASFFGLMRNLLGSKQRPVEIELKGFKQEEVSAYFESLTKAWERAADPNPRFIYTARNFSALASDQRRLSVLWRYTGGQPVRLALYSDLILEGRGMSEHLFDSPEIAAQNVPDEVLAGAAANEEKEKLYQELLSPIQSKIDKSFIHLLFNKGTRRAEIMTALARAKRGLSAEQLYYVLFPNVPLDEEPDREELEKIEKEFDDPQDGLRRLTIVKRRPDGRLGLQDEVYKIYAQVAADTPQSLENEAKERKAMFDRLEAYARRMRDLKREERRAFFADDERMLDLSNPAKANQLLLPDPTGREQEVRHRIQCEIDLWDKEELHYSLLANLSTTLNRVVFELIYQKYIAYTPDDFSDMEEIYQILYDPEFVRFFILYRNDQKNQREEQPIDVLRRLMKQAELVGWLSRFIILRDFTRAKQFVQDVNAFIDWLEPIERASWRHSLNEGERQSWIQYMRILESEEITDAVKRLNEIAVSLEKLAETRWEGCSVESNGEVEYGFLGHPGIERVKRVLTHIYNILGYGYVTLGELRLSIQYYSKALGLMRSTDTRVQMATVLNNLSRVLSDIGRHRARRVCLDGLDLRREQGSLVRIAYSMNTLALIDNDQRRPDLAWAEAATAAAYFRKTGERRGLGLALIQLGEALRRLAGDENILGRALPSDPEQIYNAAEKALDEAVKIFTTGREASEEVRLIEAYIERGCLLRDRLRTITDPAYKGLTYKQANSNLKNAADLAAKYHLNRLQLDADVNLAWMNYANGDEGKAEEILKQAEELVPPDGRIEPGYVPDPTRSDSYIYQQMSKIYGLRGKMAMERFIRRRAEIETTIPKSEREKRRMTIDQDHETQKSLRESAQHYVLAQGYAQLFSPRSGALTAIYTALYTYLKGFNDFELQKFNQYQKQERDRFQMDALKQKMEDLSDLGEFLYECIGHTEAVPA